MFYALDLSSIELIKLEARQSGCVSKSEDGGILELNIEDVLNIKTMTHELVHFKLPNELYQKESMVDNISIKATELVQEICNDLLNSQKIKEEKAQALDAFKLLDHDLEELLSNK